MSKYLCWPLTFMASFFISGFNAALATIQIVQGSAWALMSIVVAVLTYHQAMKRLAQYTAVIQTFTISASIINSIWSKEK